MHADATESPAAPPVRPPLLTRATATRWACPTALGACARGCLDVEACAAPQKRLTRRGVRDRGSLLLEPPVEFVALRRVRPHVFLEPLRSLWLARSIEQLADVWVW